MDGFTGIVERFINKLGDPSKYEFRGECIDLGSPEGYCTCGHPIRYMFLIYSPENKIAPVGSECIKHFQYYSPDLFSRLQFACDKLMENIRAAEKAERDAQHLADADAIKPQYEAAVARVRAFIANYRETHRFIPRELWDLEVDLNKGVKEYKLASAYKKYYERIIAQVNEALAIDYDKRGW